MTTVELYCVARRCGLCRFHFTKGGTIIAVKQSGELSESFACETPVDFKGNTFYIVCHGASTRECYHDKRAVGCHLDCLKLLPKKSPWEFMNAVSYNFEPPKTLDKPRFKKLHHQLAENLKTPVYLPLELRFKTAEHLLYQYAASLATTLPFRDKATLFQLKSSKDVWASTVEFEGTKYISSLTNNYIPEQHKATTEKILSPNMTNEIDAVYVCEDQWGLQKVIFGHSERAPVVDESPNVWWKTLSIPNSNSTLEAHSDGIKIHSLISVNGHERISSNDVVSWAIPQPVVHRLHIHQFYRDFRSHPPPVRMALFEYNSPNIIGYSVCCNPAPTAIHAHVAGEDMSFYESGSDSSVWVYMPLNPSELLSEIWMRTHGTSHNKLALLLKTNQQRSCLMGGRLSPIVSHASWTLLDISTGKPSRFFFDSCPQGIRSLAFENSVQPEPNENEPSLTRLISAFPRNKHRDILFCSSASLEGVKSLTVCQRKIQYQPSIIGLLIHYLDGRISSVGQIRLDSLDDPNLVQDSEGLWLGFSFTDSGHPYVANVAFKKPPEDSDYEWLDMTWDGTLEWWFSSYDCQVSYKGRRSPISQ